MSRFTRHAALATALIAPLVTAACGGKDQEPATAEVTGTAATTTVSTVAATTGTTPAEQPHSGIVATVAPSYADAERAFHGGRYEEAASMFEAYTTANPDNAWGQYMLGLSAWKNGDDTRALEAFDAALALEPTHRKSLYNSARVLLETNRPQEALDRIEKALAIEPLSGEGLRLLGRARDQLGRMPEAEDAYQRALVVDDRDTWAMNNLGYLYIEQGRVNDALLPLARAVELRGNVPVFQNNLGTALERSGHPAEARAAFEAALQADSTYTKASVALERVSAHVSSGDPSTVDLAELSQAFQALVEQWRSRVAADSAITGTSVTDSTGSTEMVRDTVTQ